MLQERHTGALAAPYSARQGALSIPGEGSLHTRRGLALGCLWSILVYSELYLYPSQYPRGSHAFRATIITARDCCQFSEYL